MDYSKIKRSDYLALERTKLANERTFLAYFRSFIVFLSSGFAILKLEILESIMGLGYLFIIVSFILLLLGVNRYFTTKKKIEAHFK